MSDSLETLRHLSAELGRNANLIQAGGGNTSLKLNGTLWVKSSGKWLIHADEEDMFLPVPMPDILACVERGEEYTIPHNGLRPSVETTMHAVIPQSCVLHVHSVNALAWAALELSPGALASRLKGLRWAWIPYIHPGLPLAQRIRDTLAATPGAASANVLLLQNHGLIVAGDTCAEAAARLSDVERRLDLAMRPLAPAAEQPLANLSTDSWQIATDPDVHALGTDTAAYEIATAGTLYPDHCVYLGHAVAALHNGESPDHAAERYTARWGTRPPVLACPGLGVLISPELSRAGREMLLCLSRVTRRIPADAEVHYLAYDDVARLMNWDAEHYRQAVAREMELD